jgi:hypothetical protein
MNVLNVGNKFNSDACFDCPVSNNCMAFDLVLQVEAKADQSKGAVEQLIESEHASSALEEAMWPPEDFSQLNAFIDRLSGDLRQAKRDFDASRRATTKFILDITKATSGAPFDFPMPDLVFESSVEEFQEAPFDTSTLDLSGKALSRVVGALVQYNQEDICKAISIEVGEAFPTR